MSDNNDHILRELFRLVQYLEPGQTLLTMPKTRRLEHANDMVEKFWPEWASERKNFEKGLQKGVEIAKELSPPAESVSNFTDWFAIGICAVGKTVCDVVTKYLAYRTAMAGLVKHAPTMPVARQARKISVASRVRSINNPPSVPASILDTESVKSEDFEAIVKTTAIHSSDRTEEVMDLVHEDETLDEWLHASWEAEIDQPSPAAAVPGERSDSTEQDQTACQEDRLRTAVACASLAMYF